MRALRVHERGGPGHLLEAEAEIPRAVVGATWSLAQGRAAFEAKHRGSQPGKAVLLVAGQS
jgi:hypothetical protein